MRIAVLTAFWQRPHISEVYWLGMQRLDDTARDLGVDLKVVAAVSPGDAANKSMAECRADVTTEVPNTPLSTKWNAASLASRVLAPDFVYIVGSDDLVSDSLITAQIKEMREGIEHSGVSDLFMWCTRTSKGLYWPGYPRGNFRYGRSIGLGRFYSRRILDAVDWKLWPDSDLSSGMDSLVDEKMLSMGIPLRAKRCQHWGGMVLDLKSDVNIWKFKKWEKNHTTAPVDATQLVSSFPELRAYRERKLA